MADSNFLAVALMGSEKKGLMQKLDKKLRSQRTLKRGQDSMLMVRVNFNLQDVYMTQVSWL